ncbi:FCD domain-containing protein [candidate division KSB3 bacterium]|uniref:FCD domain-containing protein n=1 Tax=candidate division KSB3 bacterium TaxID=2044937 RepID=A0A9D5Q5Y3_9BACT|nr:FCD domain-containing protein [candidate division KSB3 bacterium]MBD3324838.1 FCD domain-containing protein [candidate division KSB3 bacterium]
MKNENIYQDLKQKIIDEELLPEQWLVEREIGETYGISRTPVRELLRRLVSDGFLELKPGKGYLVRKLSLEEVIEIFQAREAIEGMTARLACQKGDEPFFRQINALRQRLEKLDIEENSALGVMLGKELHSAIAVAANNALVFEFYEKLRNLAALTRNISKKSIGIEQRSKDAHLALMKALEEKDADKSEQCMRDHLRSTCRSLVETYLI